MFSDRVRKNLEAIKFLATIDTQDLTKIREILNNYTGWGGLRSAIYNPTVYRELKNYLTDIEIESIKASTNSAYYTPKFITQFIWYMLMKHMDFKGGNVLETSAGHGVFLDNIPQCILPN